MEATRIKTIIVYSDRVEPMTVIIPDDCDEVEWQTDDGTGFQVDFFNDDSPFKEKKFNKSNPKSGKPIRKTKKEGSEYNANKDGFADAAPVIIVR